MIKCCLLLFILFLVGFDSYVILFCIIFPVVQCTGYIPEAPQIALRPSQARKDTKPSDRPHRSQGARLSTL